MGPRPIGRGNSRPSPPPRLSASLQWGRDRSVAEIPPDPARTNPHKLLQWGRDRSVAEILGNSWGWTVDFRGFNGAATDRSRKWAMACGATKYGAWLQWGRDRSVAEMRAPSRWLCRIHRRFNGAATDRSRKFAIRERHARTGAAASMGPRPIGRGNTKLPR